MAKKTKPSSDPDVKVIATNRQARRRWEIVETFEAGLSLKGTEVKALRDGKVNIGDAYATFTGDELFIIGLHIGPYASAGQYDQHEPLRTRKLLLKRSQLEKLQGLLAQKGYSLVVLDLHFRKAWAKVNIGLGKGKKNIDRREDIKKRQADREMARAVKIRK